MDVANELPGWSTFFAAFSEASAALLGLLFVAISLLASGWRRSGRLSFVVNESGIELLFPLLASLLMLVPGGAPIVHGLGLLLLAASGVATALRGARSAPRPTAVRIRWTDAISVIAMLLYGLSGIALLADAPIGIYGVALASFLMITAGTVNTWAMIVQPSETEDD
jgi:modulator of FtsH protease